MKQESITMLLCSPKKIKMEKVQSMLLRRFSGIGRILFKKQIRTEEREKETVSNYKIKLM